MKVPLPGKLTEWNIRQDTLQKNLCIKESKEWFGYEEMLKDCKRIMKVTALTDCQVLVGTRRIIFECKPAKLLIETI